MMRKKSLHRAQRTERKQIVARSVVAIGEPETKTKHVAYGATGFVTHNAEESN
jgi:hypothetical protein